jgi:hypothetical protein
MTQNSTLQDETLDLHSEKLDLRRENSHPQIGKTAKNLRENAIFHSECKNPC